MHRVRIILAIVILAAAGCATKPRRMVEPTTMATTAPATKPARDPKADLALDDIQPRPAMPTTAPTTNATNPPPLASLELFATARDLIIRGQRAAAIRVLEQAIKLDSESYELWFALGQAHAGVGAASDRSINAFEKAAAIDPDRLELQTELGRQYFARGDDAKAIEHLRLALLTKKYSRDDDAAAITDFYLAKALLKEGYERAALQEYDRLLNRLERPVVSIRGVPELAVVVNQPDRLFMQVGELYEKRGELNDALRAYDMAATRRPTRMDYQTKVVQTLLTLDRRDDAAERAAEVVRQLRASPESLALLSEVYKNAGGDEAVIDALARLHREKPQDHAFLFALADVLVVQKRAAEAQELLTSAAAESGYDFDITRRAFALFSDHEQIVPAARLLTEALAKKPESLYELWPMWSELMVRPSRKSHLRVPMLQAMEVSAGAEAAKLFWISRAAQFWGRDAAARTALQQAVKLSPPFPPAYRVLLSQHWMREDWDNAKKLQASQELIDAAQQQGNEALAAELRGLVLANQKQKAKAVEQFARAVRIGGNSPDLQLQYAMALSENGDNARAEQMLWKLVGDEPMCEQGYALLYHYYRQANVLPQAMRVLGTWRRADPDNVNAKLLEVTVRFQLGQTIVAEQILGDLFQHDADNAQVLNFMKEYYGQQGKLEQWIGKLEAERTKHPENRMAVEQLVGIYTSQKRVAEADRVLDAARQAVADDPDLLYYIAGLYTRVGEKQTSEQILQEILKLDPMHAPANNDLGYNWADQGKNLEQAERMIRIALQGEPDNGAFLDSLGWVLYKRGQFAEARKYFEAAVAPASFPEPVVLDHLGDSLYRLGLRDDAVREWRRSFEQLARWNSDSDEIKQLRLQLPAKIKASQDHQPVNVAPTAVPAPKQQAKN